MSRAQDAVTTDDRPTEEICRHAARRAITAVFEPGDRIVPTEEICRRASIHRATMYRWVALGVLPPLLRIGPSKSGMRESEFSAWLKSRAPR